MVLQDLSEIGYRVEWHCIPALAVGARHRRDRIWIIAHRNPDGEGESALPEYDEVEGLQEYIPNSDGERARKDNGGAGERASRIARGKDSVATEGLADPNGARGPTPKDRGKREGEEGDIDRNPLPESGGCGHDMADTYCKRVQEHWTEYQLQQAGREEQIIWRCRGQLPIRGALESVRSGGWWDTEPELGRVAHGVPNRTHRLKQLGNAVVPQIPMVIGMTINSLLLGGGPTQEVG